MDKQRPSPDIFKIDEQQFSVTSPIADDSQNTLELIEKDVRELMHRLAMAEHEKSQQEEAFRNEKKHALLALIEILDAFERVFTVIRKKQDQINHQMKKWIGNFSTVRRLLENLLFEQGVRAIENLDNGFDPKWHRVADTVPEPSKPDGTIVDQLLKGYVWNKAVLRKTEVIIVRNAYG